MRITFNNSSPDFKQFVPTEPLLRAAANVHTVDDARKICTSYSNKFVGHVGFYKTAIKIANTFLQNNKDCANFISSIKDLPKDSKINSIKEYTSKIGEYLDITA